METFSSFSVCPREFLLLPTVPFLILKLETFVHTTYSTFLIVLSIQCQLQRHTEKLQALPMTLILQIFGPKYSYKFKERTMDIIFLHELVQVTRVLLRIWPNNYLTKNHQKSHIISFIWFPSKYPCQFFCSYVSVNESYRVTLAELFGTIVVIVIMLHHTVQLLLLLCCHETWVWDGIK